MSRLGIKKIKESQVILMVIGDIMVDDFSEAEKTSKEVLSLPMYPEMSLEEQVQVVNKIERFIKRSDRKPFKNFR